MAFIATSATQPFTVVVLYSMLNRWPQPQITSLIVALALTSASLIAVLQLRTGCHIHYVRMYQARQVSEVTGQ